MKAAQARRGASQFVYLEFLDPAVRRFLTDLRNALTGKIKRSPVHITVRGPYSSPPDKGYLTELRENLWGMGVYIGGAGTFEAGDGFVVYLKAQSPIFEQIWWKPDYPTERYQRSPHVTVFETSRKRDALEVERFLRRERIEIHTFGLDLVVRTRRQYELFEPSMENIPVRFPAFLERIRVKAGILGRARMLTTSFVPAN